MWITILGLALLDSLSFASIVVTIFLLLSNPYLPARIMVYLLSVAFFYVLLGIALMNGAGAIFSILAVRVEGACCHIVLSAITRDHPRADWRAAGQQTERKGL